ncbi:MAG: hypothetical protein GY847_06490, partial [Proteobacteria bacterium]|nr:hypothetical protein [Pseudomonadota bacterium]
ISDWVDIGINISYFVGLQDAVKDYRYLYINPSVGKGLELSDTFSMNLALSFGYKLFNDRDKMVDNVFDLGFDWSVAIALTDTFYVEPAMHIAWTNIDSQKQVDSGLLDDPETPDDESVTEVKSTFGDEFMVYAGVNVGADF